MQKVDEHSAVIGTKLLFFELEWAELDDERVDALLADPRLAFAAPSPALRAPLPSAPAERARRGDPHREVGHRNERVATAVRRAGVGDHRGDRRRDRRRSKQAWRACTLPTAPFARRRPPRSPGAGARAADAQGSCSTRCSPTSRSTTGCGTSARGSRAATCRTRPATSRCRRSSTRCRAATRSRSAGTPSRPGCSASTGWPTTTGWPRSAEWRAKSVGTRRRRSCSTRTARSRASSPTPPGSSSTTRGSTRPPGPASVPARSARTPCRRTIRTCCSTGRHAGATCSRSRTRWATVCTRTSHAGRASSIRRRR